MKHPLTSKERRGLVAVAAAALLCIGSGFIFRNCRGIGGYSETDAPTAHVVTDSLAAMDSISVEERDSLEMEKKTEKKGKKRGHKKGDDKKKDEKKGKKGKRKDTKKAEKVYPVRDPLSQPCD